jgi:uncharacterized protein YbaR (Trm112 family)
MKMAKCEICDQEMSAETKSCTHQFVKIGDKWHLRNNRYFDDGPRCHDCNIENRFPNYHHPGCDMERCPVCEGQLISCECEQDGVFGMESNPCAGCGGLNFLPNTTHGTLFCRDCGRVSTTF